MRINPLFLTLSMVAVAPLAQAQKAAPAKASVKAVVKARPLTPAQEQAAHQKRLEKRVDDLWKKSDVLFHAGDYPGAVAIHRQIVKLDPTDTESYSVAAWLLWSMGKPKDSVAFLQIGLNANPKTAEMWDVAGQQYDVQKLYAVAENAFGRAISLSGPKVDQMLRRRYAHSSEHAGDIAKSIDIWTGLVADFPNEAVNKNNLARVQDLQKKKGKMPGTTVVA